MKHLFNVTTEQYNGLQQKLRHLVVKDSVKFAAGDTAIIECEDSNHRDQLEFTIVSIEHGPGSKHINSHYCLLGLYGAYITQDDIPRTVGGGPSHDTEGQDGMGC